jgi:hypothetical protein
MSATDIVSSDSTLVKAYGATLVDAASAQYESKDITLSAIVFGNYYVGGFEFDTQQE